ncbi:MAG: phenylalanine--tRNA ligase subunit beta [Clostridia bacterium]|nr:phenylalanine--tRNA ligase subunit beta [Clostridia bacterium]MBQ2237139.1 phenylalanine--tRNA ligase subunit beta [Clostridia bacterium]
MKISLNQLKTYVDINIPVLEMCDKMVMAGFEVESIEKQGDNLVNVVAAKILEITPHENSDHLQICQMDIGKGEPIQIVTGAQNISVGDLVPAALDDSYLPNGMHIVAGKLRGVPSNGMLCSGEELCLTENDYPGASVHGILILRDEHPAGTDMREVLGLDDYIIDFKITANRPDCNCFLGVAKEISVVLGTKFNPPVPEFKTIGDKIENYIDVQVENFDLCPRYMGRLVKNLRIKPSPDWMQKAITASGMRPINNIVDITNFVMLETGQPMHAFNYNDIADKKIIVRNANEGESITTLDGVEHKLNTDMLVIADGQKPSCLAGIMGGRESEIEDDTKDLFLESAKFRRDNIRHTGRALGMRTEASGRYERGTDINNVEFAMNRALQLIYELDAGDIIEGTLDRHQGLPEERIITTTTDKILELIGVDVPCDTIISILNSLGLNATIDGNEVTCRIPSIRDDIEGRADLAEEVMRIYGYDHIVGTPMRGEVIRGKKLPERLKNDKIKALLSGLGAFEVTTYSFIASKAIDTLRLAEDDARRNQVNIINPLGDEYSVMRTQLVTSMLTVLSTNINRKNGDGRFYEISKRFIPKQLPVTEQPDELPEMCIGIYGKDEDFFTLKGMVEEIMKLFGAHTRYERSSEPYLHPGRQALVKANNKPVAVLGEVHPDVAASYGIDTRVYIAEIKLDVLYTIEKRKTTYKPLPKFPAVERDFAMLCDIDIPVGNLEQAIVSGASRLLEKVELFDVYTGSQIPEGKKSVAFSVALRSSEGTLSDTQIEEVNSRIIKKLEAAGAELRK